jgi:hypothetical protein
MVGDGGDGMDALEANAVDLQPRDEARSEELEQDDLRAQGTACRWETAPGLLHKI